MTTLMGDSHLMLESGLVVRMVLGANTLFHRGDKNIEFDTRAPIMFWAKTFFTGVEELWNLMGDSYLTPGLGLVARGARVHIMF